MLSILEKGNVILFKHCFLVNALGPRNTSWLKDFYLVWKLRVTIIQTIFGKTVRV